MELLSVHIPKAAGNAVRRLLVERFGAGVQFLYGDFKDDVDYEARLAKRGSYGVVHGHVPLDLLRRHHPEARTMTWFRHPVARIESYTWFWRRTRRHGNPNHDRFLDAGGDPVWLAQLLRDEVAGYLGGTSVEELDFVGVVERFDADAARFERWLDAEGLSERSWRRPSDRWARAMLGAERLATPVANRNRKKGSLSEPARAEIEAILAEEMSIYERAWARSLNSPVGRSPS